MSKEPKPELPIPQNKEPKHIDKDPNWSFNPDADDIDSEEPWYDD